MNTIAKNTFYLYGRQIVTTVVALYSSRVVLQALGVTDLGIYSVVGSVVTIFAFASGAVSSAANRFLTYALGKNDEACLKEVFACSLSMQIMVAVVILLLIESAGVWFLNCKMNIPEGRLMTANIVLQSMAFGTVIGILAMPFSAVFGAHEQMGFPSLMSLLDAMMKLGAAIVVLHYGADRLMLYALLLLLLPVVETVVVTVVSKKRFKEVTLRPRYEKDLMKDMCRYAGWCLAGAVGVTGRNSGVNVVINMLCGVAVNASRGLACQVSAQVMGLAANLQSAFAPQITKRYAAHDEAGMIRLLMKCCTYSFFLTCMLAVPLFLRIDYVMHLWLGIVPQYLKEFTLLVIIMEMLYWLATPIGTAIGATGDNKWYQTVMAIIMLADIPVTYLILTSRVEPYYAVFGSIVIALISLIVGVVLLKNKVAALSFLACMRQTFKCCVGAVFIISACYLPHILLDENLMGLAVICGCSMLSTFIVFTATKAKTEMGYE